MVLSKDDLKEQLRRREFAPVYVLFGGETYLRDLARKTIVQMSFGEGDFRDFNENHFSLNSSDNLENALAVARQLPMMARRRVVVVTDVRVSATGYRDTVTEDHEQMLASYLSEPSPTSTIIFVADELNGVRKMGKFLRAGTASVEFAPLEEQELAGWARKEFEKAGAEIAPVTLREFVSRVGTDLRHMNNEAQKLAASAMPEGRISSELIHALIPNVREVDHFSLTDAIVAGRRAPAMNMLAKALDDGTEPLQLLGLLSYNYRRLLMAKDMMDRGVDRKEVANVMKLRFNNQEKFLAAARRVELQKLATAVRKLAQTDLAIKTSIGGSGTTGARMQLEVLVCELALL